jgi:hypothetical protein
MHDFLVLDDVVLSFLFLVVASLLLLRRRRRRRRLSFLSGFCYVYAMSFTFLFQCYLQYTVLSAPGGFLVFFFSSGILN